MSQFEKFQIENLNMCLTNFLIATILLVSGAKVIQSAGIANSLIDLTHPVDNGYTLQWPTATKFQFIIGHRGFTEAGFYYEGNDFSQAEHSGTHTDAPAHFSQVTDNR